MRALIYIKLNFKIYVKIINLNLKINEEVVWNWESKMGNLSSVSQRSFFNLFCSIFNNKSFYFAKKLVYKCSNTQQ